MNQSKKVHETAPLTSLEYSGLENLFHRIISAYEDSLNIPCEEQTPSREITRRTPDGIEIFDGVYNAYVIEDFLVKELYPLEDRCVMVGFYTDNIKTSNYSGMFAYSLIDITEFLDEPYIDIELLLEKLRLAKH